MRHYGDLTPEFWAQKPLIGMIHLPPLPGSPRDLGAGMNPVLERALADVQALEAGGAQALMIENFFDAPFAKDRLPPVTVAALTRTVQAIRDSTALPLGVNALRNDVCAALSIAHVCEAQFVRANVYVGAAVTDQGIIEGAAREAILLRKALGANVAIWADVCVKHAAQLGTDSPEAAAQDAVHRSLADAIILSGVATGAPASAEEIARVRSVLPHTPLLVGSGFDAQTAAGLLIYADGAIVGTSLKRNGNVSETVDTERVRALLLAMRAS
jgi:membrane complex biogenesis BtpA family protein